MSKSNSKVFGAPSFDQVPRSTHNLSADRYFSATVGPVYPVYHRFVYPRDKFVIKPFVAVDTFPTVYPYMSTFHSRVDFFLEPMESIYGWMDNATSLSFQDIQNRPRYTISNYSTLPAWVSIAEPRTADGPATGLDSYFPYDKRTWGVSSLMDFLGAPVSLQPYVNNNTATIISSSTYSRSYGAPFCAEPYIAFWDVYRNYYLNTQDTHFAYMSFENYTPTGGDPAYPVPAIRLEYKSTLDSLVRLVRSKSGGNTSVAGYLRNGASDLVAAASSMFGNATSLQNMDGAATNFLGYNLVSSRFKLGGLPLATYNMDFFRGIMRNETSDFEYIDTSDSTTGTVNTLRFYNKLQKFAELVDITSGRLPDWIRTVWGSKVDTRLHEPIYLGGFRAPIVFSDVIQNGAGDASNPLGTQAGLGSGGNKGRRVVFTSDSYGVLLCNFCIRPDVVYSNIVWPEDTGTTFASFYAPPMANLGFQDVSANGMFPYIRNDEPSPTPSSDTSIGKRLAFTELMTDVARSHGLFGTGQSLSRFVGNRWFGSQRRPDSIWDLENASYNSFSMDNKVLTYINPLDWNFMFADNDIIAENFRVSLHLDIDAKRVIPHRTMPSL